MLDEEFIKILACPETKKPLILAGQDLVRRVNIGIEKKLVFNKGGKQVVEKIDGGLICEEISDRIYPIRDEIPVLLIDEAILLKGI